MRCRRPAGSTARRADPPRAASPTVDHGRWAERVVRLLQEELDVDDLGTYSVTGPHTKTSLIVRREPDGLRRYVHLGTGNYNPKTLRFYTDLGLMSCRDSLGADLTDLFNFLTGYCRQETSRDLLVAPLSLRRRIGELVQREIDWHTPEEPGVIRLKLNALVDQPLILDLELADNADNMQAWHLRADRSWTRRTPQDGEEARNSQDVLMRRS